MPLIFPESGAFKSPWRYAKLIEFLESILLNFSFKNVISLY